MGLELRPGPTSAPAPEFDYTAAIVARRLDAEGETPIVQVDGVFRIDQGVSHSAAGPPLETGLYRLVADIQLHLVGHQPDDPPVWRQAASGDLIQVVTPAVAARQSTTASTLPASRFTSALGASGTTWSVMPSRYGSPDFQ